MYLYVNNFKRKTEMSAVIFQIQSFMIVLLFLLGAANRKNKFKHMRIMKTAIIWDLLLVAQIELTRGAINKASKMFANPIILNIHVSLAVGTVLLFGWVFYSGQKLSTGEEGMRKMHKKIGITTLSARIATLITSYFV